MFEALGDSLVLRGDVRDLISNAAERVIGLGINRDGTLGVARGNQAYFFNQHAAPAGHDGERRAHGRRGHAPGERQLPVGPGQRLAFVSGTEDGRPYIDVLNAFNFMPSSSGSTCATRWWARWWWRRAAPGDPANVNLRLYALTTTGVLALPITNQDLQSPQAADGRWTDDGRGPGATPGPRFVGGITSADGLRSQLGGLRAGVSFAPRSEARILPATGTKTGGARIRRAPCAPCQLRRP